MAKPSGNASAGVGLESLICPAFASALAPAPAPAPAPASAVGARAAVGCDESHVPTPPGTAQSGRAQRGRRGPVASRSVSGFSALSRSNALPTTERSRVQVPFPKVSLRGRPTSDQLSKEWSATESRSRSPLPAFVFLADRGARPTRAVSRRLTPSRWSRVRRYGRRSAQPQAASTASLIKRESVLIGRCAWRCASNPNQ